MGRLVVGGLVSGEFPFSSEDRRKRRPCIVVASWPFGLRTDVLVCMVTSQRTTDPHAIPISTAELTWGSLPVAGFVRPLYLFAGSEDLFETKGQVEDALLDRIVQTIRNGIG